MSDGIGIPYTQAAQLTPREAELLRALREAETSLTACEGILSWIANNVTRNPAMRMWIISDQQTAAIQNPKLRKDVLSILRAKESA